MKLLAIAFGALIALAAAVPADAAEDNSLFAREDGPKHARFPGYPPASTITSTTPPTSTPAPPPQCDERCRKYHCCYPWGECYCRAEVLAEFEQFDSQFSYSTGTTSAVPTTTAPPPPPPGCDPRCNKYHCCNSFGGCNCMAETLDELERAEKEDTVLSIDDANGKIDPMEVDLGSEVNADYVCPYPCGPIRSKCCWFGSPPHGTMCICPKGNFPSLDKQNEAAVEGRSILGKR